MRSFWALISVKKRQPLRTAGQANAGEYAPDRAPRGLCAQLQVLQTGIGGAGSRLGDAPVAAGPDLVRSDLLPGAGVGFWVAWG